MRPIPPPAPGAFALECVAGPFDGERFLVSDAAVGSVYALSRPEAGAPAGPGPAARPLVVEPYVVALIRGTRRLVHSPRHRHAARQP